MSGEAYPIRAAVLTVSDRCSRGEAVDTSGPGLCEMLRSRLNAVIVATRCLPDEADALAACFVEWSRAEAGIDLVLSTGGTGLAPRDVTPEAAKRVFFAFIGFDVVATTAIDYIVATITKEDG